MSQRTVGSCEPGERSAEVLMTTLGLGMLAAGAWVILMLIGFMVLASRVMLEAVF